MNETQRRTLILASGSPRRQELIRILPFPHEIFVSDADETVDRPMHPSKLVEELALRKADSVYRLKREAFREGVIIGADTVVVLDEAVLGKPSNQQEARKMLAALQGRSHIVYSGVACIEVESNHRKIAHRSSIVSIKSLSMEQIDRYVASGEPMDKAGAYAIQGIGATFVESIEGCYFNVVGLPLSLLSDMLAELGMPVL